MTPYACETWENNWRVWSRGCSANQGLPLVRGQWENLSHLAERDVHCTRDSTVRRQLFGLENVFVMVQKIGLKPVSRLRPEHLLRPGQHIVLHRLLLTGDEVGRMKKDFSRGDNWQERRDMNAETRRITLVDSSPIVVVANSWHLIWIWTFYDSSPFFHSFRKTSPKT